MVALCSILTLVAQILARRFSPGTDPSGAIGAFNSMVSIAAIVSSAYLVGRGQAAESALRQAEAELARAMARCIGRGREKRALGLAGGPR